MPAATFRLLRFDLKTRSLYSNDAIAFRMFKQRTTELRVQMNLQPFVNAILSIRKTTAEKNSTQFI